MEMKMAKTSFIRAVFMQALMTWHADTVMRRAVLFWKATAIFDFFDCNRMGGQYTDVKIKKELI